jgi:hypothetical protein
MITRHIADLLYHHECVIVPGLGGFIKAIHPARILHTTNEFYPPSGSIAFNAGLSGNDGLLANYIASLEKKSYREALLELKHWSETCINSLKHGERIVLEGIGDLFMNASGNIEFSPSRQINFNADAFGLPVFFAKTVVTEPFIIPEIQPVKHPNRDTKLRRLIPETLKWAAVLAPFIGFALWGSLNGNIVDNYVHNYTGMYSWVRSTPGKTATVKPSTLPVRVIVTPKEIVESPAGILAAKNVSFDPNTVSYAELAKQNITFAGSTNVAETGTLVDKQDFHIIAGAFRDHNNALKLIAILQEQGYPAAIVDTTSRGLYVVSMKGFSNYNEATSQLDVVKKAGFSASWILKKHKNQG